jgi:hypothetical protein
MSPAIIGAFRDYVNTIPLESGARFDLLLRREGREMSKTRRTIGLFVVGPVLVALCLAGYAADKNAENAKMYQKTLEGMKGQDLATVLSRLQEWEFGALDSWTAENPTWQDVKKHNRSKVTFSKDDYSTTFAPGGSFKVCIYNKLIGTDTSHIGEIDSMGRGVMKDGSINLEQYTAIRVVFQDGKLIQSKVWPKLDQSGFTGGTWLRR